MFGTEVRENSSTAIAPFGERHAGLLEPEALHVRLAAGREHDAIDDEGFAVGQLDVETVIDLLDGVDGLLARRS